MGECATSFRLHVCFALSALRAQGFPGRLQISQVKADGISLLLCQHNTTSPSFQAHRWSSNVQLSCDSVAVGALVWPAAAKDLALREGHLEGWLSCCKSCSTQLVPLGILPTHVFIASSTSTTCTLVSYIVAACSSWAAVACGARCLYWRGFGWQPSPCKETVKTCHFIDVIGACVCQDDLCASSHSSSSTFLNFR